ncbi:MAG: glycosyltransferase family 4 protein [Candidatus Omnitrophota bacterium]
MIEQFLPAFHYGDAIGNCALGLHRFLLQQGIDSRIIALSVDESLKNDAILFKDYHHDHHDHHAPKSHSLKILHFAIPSVLTDFFLETHGPKAMIYHNITPPHFFLDFSDSLVRFTHEGRKHLERLRNCFDIAIADSNYNANELRALNYQNVRAFPLTVPLSDYDIPFKTAYHHLLNDERKKNIVFVGRISPNKKIEDLIRTLAVYKKYLSPAVRLIIAGNTGTLPTYFYALKELARNLRLSNHDVIFTGHIPFDELLAVYRLGDVFLSMSEHEGFCLPLIESCYFQVPVVAFDAGAVSETLDGSGILFHEKKYDAVAGLLEQVIHHQELRSQLSELQKERIAKYKRDADPFKLLDHFSSWID